MQSGARSELWIRVERHRYVGLEPSEVVLEVDWEHFLLKLGILLYGRSAYVDVAARNLWIEIRCDGRGRQCEEFLWHDSF